MTSCKVGVYFVETSCEVGNIMQVVRYTGTEQFVSLWRRKSAKLPAGSVLSSQWWRIKQKTIKTVREGCAQTASWNSLLSRSEDVFMFFSSKNDGPFRGFPGLSYGPSGVSLSPCTALTSHVLLLSRTKYSLLRITHPFTSLFLINAKG